MSPWVVAALAIGALLLLDRAVAWWCERGTALPHQVPSTYAWYGRCDTTGRIVSWHRTQQDALDAHTPYVGVSVHRNSLSTYR